MVYPKTIFSVLVLSAVAAALPAADVEIVESTIREVRAAAPEDLRAAATDYENYNEGDDEDSVGYLKKSEEGGSDGYKHFDSFHKKDGDKYGYEKHTSFGKASKIEDDSGDDGEETKKSYRVAEDVDEGDEGYGAHYESDESGESGEYNDGESEELNEGEHYSDDDESAKYTNEDVQDSEEYGDY